MNNVFDTLMGEVEATIAKPEHNRHATCQACMYTYEIDSEAPRTCPSCNTQCFQWVHADREQSISFAKRAAEKASPDQQPKTEKPKRTRTKKKAEAVQTEQSTPSNADEPLNAPAANDERPDLKAEREAAVQQFILDNNLNELTPVPVGHATVQTIGFTKWVDKKPVYRFQQAFETGRDFAEVYDSERALQPALMIDACQCSNVSNPALERCLFRGDLVASLNNGHGTTMVRRGDKVVVGAYRTANNRIRFAVLKIER